MVDWTGLVLIVGLVVSGFMLVRSMEAGQSVLTVRFFAVVSIVLMVAFILHIARSW